MCGTWTTGQLYIALLDVHTHIHTCRHINNSGILGSDPLGPGQKETLIKALLFQEEACMVSGSYLNKPQFTGYNHMLTCTHCPKLDIHNSQIVLFNDTTTIMAMSRADGSKR